MTESAFSLHDVSYRYRDSTAIDRLTLDIGIGERIALLGANGSGKSTLLRLLDALYFPTSGTLCALGETLTEAAFQDPRFASRFRRRVGYVFQDADVQLFSPTVFDELAFGPLQLEWPRDMIRAKVGEMLEAMAISHLARRPPHRLSGGEKKRVALASVLITEPDILLLDEPTTGLDPQSQSQVIDLLASWRGGHRTVITATHDLDIVEDIADGCIVLETGHLAAQGTPRAVLGDLALLQRTRLIHSHRHTHADGTVHRHLHLHRHEHGAEAPPPEPVPPKSVYGK